MNKRGQLGVVVLLLLFLLLVGAWFASSNPYKSFKSDCRDSYEKEFQINSTCTFFYAMDGSFKEEPCQKTDWDSLDKFCLDKYAKVEQKGTGGNNGI